MLQARNIAYSPLMNIMVDAVQKACRGLIRDFGEVEQLQASRRGLAEFVATTATRAEKSLIRELEKARPAFGFLTEYSGDLVGNDPAIRWIISPLDGSLNFLHGIPHFALSLALERQGEITSAVIFNPLLDELYWSEKGKGSYCNQHRMRVSGRRTLEESLIADGTPQDTLQQNTAHQALLNKTIPLVAGLRRFGCSALDLAYIASGRLDGFIESGLAPWNLASGMLMITEAGGKMCDFDGNEATINSANLMACSNSLFEPLKELVV